MQSTNPNAELLAQEAKVANLLSLAWTEFAKLTRDDAGRQDFLRLINQAQYMVLAGPGIRQLNEVNAVNQANLQSELQARGEVAQRGEPTPEEEAQMPDGPDDLPPVPPQPGADNQRAPRVVRRRAKE